MSPSTIHPTGEATDPADYLIVGFRGSPFGLLEAISLCRLYHGSIVVRAGDVLVVEFVATSDRLDQLLSRLPRTITTHLWRARRHALTPGARVHPQIWRRSESASPGSHGSDFVRQAVDSPGE